MTYFYMMTHIPTWFTYLKILELFIVFLIILLLPLLFKLKEKEFYKSYAISSLLYLIFYYYLYPKFQHVILYIMLHVFSFNNLIDAVLMLFMLLWLILFAIVEYLILKNKSVQHRRLKIMLGVQCVTVFLLDNLIGYCLLPFIYEYIY